MTAFKPEGVFEIALSTKMALDIVFVYFSESGQISGSGHLFPIKSAIPLFIIDSIGVKFQPKDDQVDKYIAKLFKLNLLTVVLTPLYSSDRRTREKAALTFCPDLDEDSMLTLTSYVALTQDDCPKMGNWTFSDTEVVGPDSINPLADFVRWAVSNGSYPNGNEEYDYVAMEEEATQHEADKGNETTQALNLTTSNPPKS